LSFEHKVASSIIVVLKIEVSSRQPLGTPNFQTLRKVQNLRETTLPPLSGG